MFYRIKDKRKGLVPNLVAGLAAFMWFLLIHTDSLCAQALTRPVDGESSIHFTIRNFGINVDGSLSGLKGEMVFDPGRLAATRFEVSMTSATIQTGNRLRDDHLRKKEYLDVINFPEIFFHSSAVRQGATADSFLLSGMLTIKGVGKIVEIPFRAEKYGTGYRFTGSCRINRRDFNVGGPSISLSDNLTISLRIISR